MVFATKFHSVPFQAIYAINILNRRFGISHSGSGFSWDPDHGAGRQGDQAPGDPAVRLAPEEVKILFHARIFPPSGTGAGQEGGIPESGTAPGLGRFRACPLPRPGGVNFEQPGASAPGWQADNSPSPEGPAETSAVGRPFGARRIGFAHTWGCHPRLFKGRPFRAVRDWEGFQPGAQAHPLIHISVSSPEGDRK